MSVFMCHFIYIIWGMKGTLKWTRQWLGMAVVGVTFTTLGMTAASPAQAATYNLDFEYFDLDTRQNPITDSIAGNPYGIGDQWAGYGVNINATNKAGSNPEPLLLFESRSNGYTGGDKDLRSGSRWGTPELGNVLIIQEDGFKSNGMVKNAHDPDDEANGGIINFEFFNPDTQTAKLVNFEEFSLLDIDDNGGGIRVEAYDTNNNKVLDIDVDALMALHKSTNGGNGAAAAQGASVTRNGVTMTQVGTKWGNNSLFKFAIADTEAAEVKFRYPGSGAIAGLQWNDEEEEPPHLPEPTSVLGVLLVGAVGARSILARKAASTARN